MSTGSSEFMRQSRKTMEEHKDTLVGLAARDRYLDDLDLVQSAVVRNSVGKDTLEDWCKAAQAVQRILEYKKGKQND